MDHYEILGVARDADAKEIKQAYRRLSKEYHPDRDGGDHEKMAALTLAYRILSDPEMRARYDRTGMSDRPPDIELQAQGMIQDVFAQYLETGGEENPLDAIRFAINEGRGQTHGKIVELSKKKARVRRKANAVKRKKAGADLYAAVVAGKLQELAGKIEHAQTFLKLTDHALAILDEYECDIQPTKADPFAALIKQHHQEAQFKNVWDKT